MLKRFAILLALSVLVSGFAMAQEGALTLTPLGTYETGLFDEGAAEIVTYDPVNQRAIVVNSGEGSSVDFLDISDPASPTLAFSVDMTVYGDGANGIAYANGVVAVAVQAEAVDGAGVIALLNADDGSEIGVAVAGVLPDMVGFTPDGSTVVSANEGEPSDDYSIDPEGSITIVDVATLESTQVTFEGVEIPEGVRIFGPNATPQQDLEPEYIAVSPDGTTAYVTLQENNAIAVVDIAAAEVTAIFPLGFKDYSLEENAIDPSNEDGEIAIRPVPVFGMYQPDAIATYEVDGAVYIVSANEGDARDYDTYSEEERIADITLDEEAFPNAAELQEESNLGRLLITTTLGDTDGDGDFDELYNYGARSFSIWDAEGNLVFDSAGQFEAITAELIPEAFNSQGANESFDNRSDDKGPEPEAVVVGEVDGVPYAFIGLERVGGVMVYNVADPAAPEFVTYVNNNNPEGSAEEMTAGDIAPEGMIFVTAEDSPTGSALLIVSNEVSGTTTIYGIE
ncbi:MAG: choice-of-anchor I family protein [Chloroflexota bacterium]